MAKADEIEPAAPRMARRVKAFREALDARSAAMATFDGPSASLEQDPTRLHRALQELRAQHDELLTADEELRAQLDEVVALTNLAALERERYRELFDGAPQAYLVTDPAGVIRQANRAAIRILAPEGRTLVGRPVAILAVATETRMLRDALNEATREGRASAIVQLRRSASASTTAEMTCTVIEKGARRFWTVAEVVVPATPTGTVREKELERRLRDTEELLVRERRIRVQLERNDRAKDRFIEVLSRDLRGPIHSVLGWAELLRRETFAKEARDRAAATIERNARAQLALVDELLDISRITAEKLRLEIVALDLAVLARRVVERHEAVARDREVSVVAKLAAVTIFADRRRVEQVIQNLLGNALKFTPAHGTIALTVARVGAHAFLEVKDTGRGIDPAVQARIFDCDGQTHDADGSRSGRGLGLFVVRQLVEMQGGTVEVSSEGVGNGATFVVCLPAREPHEADDPSAIALPDSQDELEGIHVLVVEDDEDLRGLLGSLLGGAGARVSSAATVERAFQMFATEDPDVMLSDLGLPDGDGCELVKRIRAVDPRFPAIALSGFTFASDVKRALEAGFRHHLAKPVTPEGLISAIAEVVRNTDSGRTARTRADRA